MTPGRPTVTPCQPTTHAHCHEVLDKVQLDPQGHEQHHPKIVPGFTANDFQRVQDFTFTLFLLVDLHIRGSDHCVFD